MNGSDESINHCLKSLCKRLRKSNTRFSIEHTTPLTTELIHVPLPCDNSQYPEQSNTMQLIHMMPYVITKSSRLHLYHIYNDLL